MFLAGISIERAASIIELLTVLNREILWYISGAFEADILASEDPDEKIRDEVRMVLERVYSDSSGVEVHIIPAIKDGLDMLDESLAENVQRYLEQRTDISTTEGLLGIAVHHGTTEFEGAVIVIDGRASGTEIMAAEINAASILYMSIASAILSAESCETDET